MKFYCGIDLGARKTHVCLIDEEDHKLLDMKMDNHFGVIEAALRAYRSSLEVVVESTINWEWLVYGLQKYGYEVKLAHTLGLKAITWSKKKTDTWDAFTLAKLLRGRLIPQAYIYPYELRPVRDLARERIRLVTKRATEYGAINRTLLKYNIQGFDRNAVKHWSEQDMHELYRHPFMRTKATMELQRIELLTEQDDLRRSCLMSTRRTFSNEFKRQVVEEILSGGTTTAAACRKYAIAYPVIARWKKAYSLGRLDNEPTTDAGYQEKIAKLEQKVGHSD